MNEISVSIFLSHATHDKNIASTLKEKLACFEINVFLAHDDLKGGVIWDDELNSEIKNCDIFMVLLSKQYHKASYTDQELGIGLANNKTIIPISIDGTMPYGFIKKIQSILCEPEFDDKTIHALLELIAIHSDSGKITIDQIINKIINSLTNSTTYNQSIECSKQLSLYSQFTDNQINDIARASINNNQIYRSAVAYPKIYNILKKHNAQIESNIKKELGI